MEVRWVLVTGACALLLGCGRFGFDPTTSVDDPDASDGTPLIDPRTPFDPPAPIEEIVDADAADDDPELSSDGLELYFARKIAADQRIWVATRPTTADPWGAPRRLDELGANVNESGPALSEDGLTLWLARSNGPNSTGVWVSTRPDRSSTWSLALEVSELNIESRRGSSSFNGGLSMALNSAIDGERRKLYVTHRAADGSPWQTATVLDELHDPSSGERNPFIEKSGLVIYYASNITGSGEIYVATRESLQEPFGAPVKLESLSSSDTEDDPTLSADRRTIYFSRDDAGLRIFAATR